MPGEYSETLGDIVASQPISIRSIEDTLRELHDDTHHDRLELQEQMDEGKGTPAAYARHEKDYNVFWAEDQERRITEDPTRSKVPAEPINATKVAHFLAYEAFREKVLSHLFPFFNSLKSLLSAHPMGSSCLEHRWAHPMFLSA